LTCAGYGRRLLQRLQKVRHHERHLVSARRDHRRRRRRTVQISPLGVMHVEEELLTGLS